MVAMTTIRLLPFVFPALLMSMSPNVLASSSDIFQLTVQNSDMQTSVNIVKNTQGDITIKDRGHIINNPPYAFMWTQDYNNSTFSVTGYGDKMQFNVKIETQTCTETAVIALEKQAFTLCHTKLSITPISTSNNALDG
ncbi:hypothetical protein C9J12_25775 [Photobacterium frigidiphilum]|uniref:Uncharacterized protein n=1 Tax=Photobacterium frigidiphilum TaxID=264736 RepID=A0A2T3J7T2_9GAMM|nr:hypothetical protein [Photobacterium frigidiphilum]PSU44809.1 hypothetical protein C9J12_25775 [Photobacterium frigidiphilum]